MRVICTNQFVDIPIGLEYISINGGGSEAPKGEKKEKVTISKWSLNMNRKKHSKPIYQNF